MLENRNTPLSSCNSGTVCIDTMRVLDSCKDRDCFEDVRVYLTNYGDEILASSSNVRIRSAEIVCAYVGIDEVAFNPGFYKITVRYFVSVEAEACVGIGKSQFVKGIASLEKEVVLYGGEGTVTSYTSGSNNSYCAPCTTDNIGNNAPKAIVESVEPIVLGYRVKECCAPCDCYDIPECVRCCVDGELSTASDGPRLYVSFGLFSVIRIERPTQLLVQATDYSVPDKECFAQDNNENPCDLFRTMAFPTSKFKTGCINATANIHEAKGNCGCKKN